MGVPGGLIGGRIYFLITTPSQIPPHWWGPFAIWKGGLGIWGGIAGGVARRAVVVLRRRRSRRRDVRAVHGRAPRRGCCRAGDRPDRQLLQPGAVRQADDAAVGAEDRPGAPPARIRAVRDVPADVPLRDHLEPVARGIPGRGSGARARSGRRALFALYVAGYSGFRIFEETLRIDYSNHILGMRLNFWIAPLCASPGWRGSSRSSAAGGGAARPAGIGVEAASGAQRRRSPSPMRQAERSAPRRPWSAVPRARPRPRLPARQT